MAQDPIDIAAFLVDPLAVMADAREQHWNVRLMDGTVLVLRHEAAHRLFGDGRLHANFPDFLRAFGVTGGPFFEWMASSPLNREGAEHTRWRSVLSRTFTPRSVEQVRPFLHAAAQDLIDGFVRSGACDFMAAYADIYPSLGLCELIGVPKEDRDRFRRWANTIGFGFNPIELVPHIAEVDDALLQLLAYTTELAAARRLDPQDDLVTKIAHAGDEAGWAPEDIPAAIAGLVFAGHETTKNQLGWMIATLSEHPDIWDDVAAGRTAASAVIEELMRHRGAVSAAGRTLVEPVEHDGERFEPGTRVLLSLWSSNRDPAAFPNPDAFDPHRSGEAPHIAFGHGAHHCLGAALARAELADSLDALAQRITCPHLEDGAVWRPPVGITGPVALPISFSAR